MPFNGAGTFQPIPPPDYPAVPGTTISSTHYNNYTNDLMAGLTNCVTRDGQSPATNNLPMGGFRHTGVGQALAADQYATLGQLVATAASFSNLAGYRNKIINGDFSVWQRGTSQTASGYGSADRWALAVIGSSDTVARQSFTIGQTAVPGNPRYFYRNTVTSVAGAGNAAFFLQRMEDVTILQGLTVRLSFWAKADANKSIAIEFVQNFGTGGSADVVGIGSQKVNLTTNWARYSVSVIIPSITGKTVDIGTSYTAVNFWLDAGSGFNARTASLGQQSGIFDFSLVQVEIGAAESAFEALPLSETLFLCQRYYQRGQNSTVNSILFSGNVTASGGYAVRVEFITMMRSTPVITGTTFSHTNFAAAVGSFFAGASGFQETRIATGSGVGAWNTEWEADAEL